MPPTTRFARAFERWDQYDSHRPLRAWLHGIVSHAALDDLRRRRVRRLAACRPWRSCDRVRGRGRRRATDPADRVATAPARRCGTGRPQARRPSRPRPAPLLRLRLRRDRRLPRTSPGNVGSILSRAHAALRDRLAADRTAADDARGAEASRTMTRGVPMDPERHDPADRRAARRCGARRPRPRRRRRLEDAAPASRRADLAGPRRARPTSAGGGGSGLRWTRRLVRCRHPGGRRDGLALVRGGLADGPRSDQGASVRRVGAPRHRARRRPAGDQPVRAARPLDAAAAARPERTICPTRRASWSGPAAATGVADLATGTSVRRPIRPGRVRPRCWPGPGGAGSASAGIGAAQRGRDPNRAASRSRSLDADGTAVERPRARTNRGTPDPTEARSGPAPAGRVHRSGTDDGRFALIGLDRRDGATAGSSLIDMLDLASLEIDREHPLTLDEPWHTMGVRGSSSRRSRRCRLRATPLLPTSGTTTSGPSGPSVPGGVGSLDRALRWRCRPTPAAGQVRLVPAGSSSWADCSEIAASAADGGTYRTACVRGFGPGDRRPFPCRRDHRRLDRVAAGGQRRRPDVDGETASALFIWRPGRRAS